MGQQHRKRGLTHEIMGDASEEAFDPARVTIGACNDEVGVLRVETGEQRVDGRKLARSGPPLRRLGDHSMAAKVVGERVRLFAQPVRPGPKGESGYLLRPR